MATLNLVGFLKNAFNTEKSLCDIIFVFNLILLANLYVYYTQHQTLPSYLHTMPADIFPEIFYFLIIFIVYTYLIWPNFVLLVGLVSIQLTYWLSNLTKTNLLETERKYNPKFYIHENERENIALMTNNTAKLKFLDRRRESNQEYYNLVEKIRSFFFLLSINVLDNDIFTKIHLPKMPHHISLFSLIVLYVMIAVTLYTFCQFLTALVVSFSNNSSLSEIQLDETTIDSLRNQAEN